MKPGTPDQSLLAVMSEVFAQFWPKGSVCGVVAALAASGARPAMRTTRVDRIFIVLMRFVFIIVRLNEPVRVRAAFGFVVYPTNPRSGGGSQGGCAPQKSNRIRG